MTLRTAIAPAILMLAAVLALSACGNKGPLLLPDETAQDAFEDEAPVTGDEPLDEADAPPADAVGDDPQGDDDR